MKMALFENPTFEEILQQKEGQLFERKSARIEPRELANHFIAFANADGGFIAIGVERDGTITGINSYQKKVNAFLQAGWDFCVPPVAIIHRFVDCINYKNDTELLLKHH